MRNLIRRVTRGSKKKFDYSLNLPAIIVRKLELPDSSVTIQLQGEKIIIEKIMDNTSTEKSKTNSVEEIPDDDDYTIH